MTVPATEVPEAPPTLEPLKVADRCDRCGAQAFVRVQLMEGDLLFCGHDFAKHEEALRKAALQVLDEREKINTKPSMSANAE